MLIIFKTTFKASVFYQNHMDDFLYNRYFVSESCFDKELELPYSCCIQFNLWSENVKIYKGLILLLYTTLRTIFSNKILVFVKTKVLLHNTTKLRDYSTSELRGFSSILSSPFIYKPILMKLSLNANIMKSNFFIFKSKT